MCLKVRDFFKDKKVGTEVPLPESWWHERAPEAADIPEGVFVIQTDASFKKTGPGKGIVGISVIVKTENREYKPKEFRRRAEGPVHAELKAIRLGLKRLHEIKRGKCLVVLYTDCRSCFRLLKGINKPRRDYIKEEVRKINALIKRIDCPVEVVPVKTKVNRRVDRRALKERKKEEQRKQQQIRERLEKVKKRIERGRNISIVKREDGYYAIPKNGGFPPGVKVSLNPPSCECSWWKKRWGDKSQEVINARALPCKHMCALAEYLGLDIYQIFEKQIKRVD
ncbi:MAG: reverse transcriptase-like protein [Deltaproteobacteria bacterium]|nr:reverse transcriptase-like protein [Deltaproteobacteria bacterium]